MLKYFISFILIFSFEYLLALVPSRAAQIISAPLSDSAWVSVVQTNWNAFLWWRADPVLQFISKPYNNLHSITADISYIIAASFCFSLGLVLLLTQYGYNLKQAVVTTITLCLGLKLIFGFDLILFSSLAWWPWLTISLTMLFSDKTVHFSFILSLYFCWRLTQAANSLSLTLLLLAITILICTHKIKINTKHTILTTFLILICLYPFYQAPALNFHAYPATAHMGPEYGVSAFVFPLLGPAPKVSFIDREFLKASLQDLGIALAFLSIIFVAYFYRRTDHKRPLFLAIIFLSLSLFLDLSLPEKLAHISPLASFSRLIPGLFLVPASTILIPFIFIFFTIAFKKSSLPTATFSICLLALMQPQFDFTKLGIMISDARQTLIAEYEQLSSEEKRAFSYAYYSPSYQVLNQTGFWPLRNIERLKMTSFYTPSQNDLKIFGSVNFPETPLANLLDKDPSTRWSTGGGRQTGEEWLYLLFNQPTSIPALQLSTGDFFTDYARGIQVATFEACPQQVNNDANSWPTMRILLSIQDWPGALSISLNNYPFYFPQHTVNLHFSEVSTVSCLLIRQTGHDKYYDWSIADLKIGILPYNP